MPGSVSKATQALSHTIVGIESIVLDLFTLSVLALGMHIIFCGT